MSIRVSYLSAQTKIKRNRLLPGDGHVKVLGGQQVKANDVIAEMEAHQKHMVLNVRDSINVSPSEDINHFIHRKELEWVDKGDLIAEKNGLFKRVLRSPVKGKIISIDNGIILIESHSPTKKLLAGFDGTVVEIFPERGAAIETTGALLQCVWGNNYIGSGTLLSSNLTSQDISDPTDFDMNMRGAIFSVNIINSIGILNTINQLNPRGLIIGSIPAKLFPIIRSQKYPIVLLEGFGNSPINKYALDILIQNNNQHVCINAQSIRRDETIRPEIIIPSESLIGEEIIHPVEFAPGQIVRIHDMGIEPNLGTIEKIYNEKIKFDNGIFANAANIMLESSMNINCPLSNLEILVR